jgi:hypothetical protein
MFMQLQRSMVGSSNELASSALILLPRVLDSRSKMKRMTGEGVSNGLKHL